MFGAANKGALQMVAAGLMAMFNDDTTTLQAVLTEYRTLAHIGLSLDGGSIWNAIWAGKEGRG